MSQNVHSWGRFLVNTVRDYTKKNGIDLELFSGDWIMRLTSKNPQFGGSTTKYIFGNDFGLNNTAARNICRDKSATYIILTREGVSVLEHRILLKPGSLGAPEGGSFAGVLKTFREFGSDVVCKPNAGGGGIDIYRVTSIAELEEVTISLFNKHRAITISPFVDIEAEYRVCVLASTIELVYEKVRQRDSGSFQHNLSHGALAQDVQDKKLLADIITLAQQATKAIGSTFVNVDIIKVGGKLKVLEINSSIMFNNYATQSTESHSNAVNIYHKALDILFK